MVWLFLYCVVSSIGMFWFLSKEANVIDLEDFLILMLLSVLTGWLLAPIFALTALRTLWR